MRLHVYIGAAALAAVLAAAAPARAQFDELGEGDPCSDPIDHPQAVPWREAAIDLSRAACVNGEVGARAGGRVLIDEPDFYGTLGGDLAIETAFVEAQRFEWGLAFRVVDLAFVQNAVWKQTTATYGPVSVHAAASRRTTLNGRPLVQAVRARIALPYTQSRLDSTSGALQVTGVSTWQVRTRTRLHARATVLGWFGSSVGGATARAALGLGADASWRANRWLSLTGGLDVQVGWHGVGLDHVAARAGFRWRIRGAWRGDVGLGAPVPLVGAERVLAVGTFALHRDLD